MKAIILAAGRGSRMGSITSDQPKCMTELTGKSLLQWQLDALAQSDVGPVGICTGYLDHTLVPFADTTFHNARWSETQMLRSLMCAEPWLSTETCVVTYSDIAYEADAVAPLRDAPGDVVITYHTGWQAIWEARFEDPLSDAETFKTTSDGLLAEIGGRADHISEICGQYMGLLKFTPRGWSQVTHFLSQHDEHTVDRMDMTTLLRGLINNGVSVHTVPVSGLWLEVDTESDWRLYQEQLAG